MHEPSGRLGLFSRARAQFLPIRTDVADKYQIYFFTQNNKTPSNAALAKMVKNKPYVVSAREKR